MSLKMVEFEEGYYVKVYFRDGGADVFEVVDLDDVVDHKDKLIITVSKGDVVEVQKAALAYHRVTYFRRQVKEPADMIVEPSTGPENIR